MKTYNTTDKLPKGVKRLADVDIYVNGEWVKTQHIGRVTARQMIAAATKIAKRTAKETNADHVHIFAAFGSLHLAEIIATANGVTLEIPACALRCLLKDIEETTANTTPETTDTMDTTTKTLTVKRSEWNETAKRLECAGWFYIGTPTATGKTIYRRDNSEIEIIIEEDTTPATMNETKTTAIYNRVDSMKTRGAWNNGVKTYALMLLDWYMSEASENPLTLETMLNGANDWQHYSRSGCGVAQCYNANIAETLCNPTELKRFKGGLKAPNSVEHWPDVEARALCQAWRLIKDAETLVNCNA